MAPRCQKLLALFARHSVKFPALRPSRLRRRRAGQPLSGELGRARVVLGRLGLELLSVLALHPVGRRAVRRFGARVARAVELDRLPRQLRRLCFRRWRANFLLDHDKRESVSVVLQRE